MKELLASCLVGFTAGFLFMAVVAVTMQKWWPALWLATAGLVSTLVWFVCLVFARRRRRAELTVHAGGLHGLEAFTREQHWRRRR